MHKTLTSKTFDELIVDFIGNTLKERKVRRKNFEPFICQSFHC